MSDFQFKSWREPWRKSLMNEKTSPWGGCVSCQAQRKLVEPLRLLDASRKAQIYKNSC